jgi:hypothetical protein
MVHGVGLVRVVGSGFRVQGLVRAWGLEPKGLGRMVKGSGFMV